MAAHAATSASDATRSPGGESSSAIVTLLAALIVVLGTWAFAPALRGGFVWDDASEIVRNDVIKDPAGLAKIWRGEGLLDYFPLKTTVQWVQWRLWQADTFGYHVTNLTLHLASALLLWRVLARLGLRADWVAGLLFAVHPLTVESVAWIAELKNALSLPPLLLAAERFIVFVETGRRRAQIAAAAWFTVAMLCKTSVVAFPVLLLAFLWWRRGRLERADLGRTLPFFAVSLALGAVTLWFQTTRAIGTLEIPSGGALERVGRAGLALAFYLWKSLVPLGLAPVYPREVVAGSPLVALVAWLALAGGLAWCWRRRATWGRGAAFAALWFELNLAPVLGFVDISYLHIAWVADHFAYLSLLAIAAVAAVAFERVAQHSAAARGGVIVALAGVAAVFVFQTRALASHFRSEEALWRHGLARNPASWLAHNNLATALIDAGRPAEALTHATEALRLRPDYADASYTQAAALTNLGRLDEAIAVAARLQPSGRQVADLNLKIAANLLRANRVADALPHYELALRIAPDWAPAHKEAAVAFYLAGRRDAALEHYARGIALAPDAATLSNYGVALVAAGRREEALRQHEHAVRLDPEFAEARYHLGVGLLWFGRAAEARPQLEAAVRAQPARAEAWHNLGEARLMLGDRAAAEAAFAEALRLQPKLAASARRLEELRGNRPP